MPEDGTPAPEVHDEFSSVTDVTERVVGRIEDLGPGAKTLAAALVAELVPSLRKAERRAADRDSKVLASRGGEDLGERLDGIEARLDRLTGPDERNGRVGRLDLAVAEIQAKDKRRANWIIAAATTIGLSIGGSAFSIYDRVSDNGRDNNRLDRVERDAADLADDLKDFRAEFWRSRLNLPGVPAPHGDDR